MKYLFAAKWEKPGVVPEAAKELRTLVFVEEQQFSIESEFDELDAAAHHLVLYDNAGNAAACGRVLEEKEPGSFKIGRIAVSKKLRGTGVGLVLLEELEKKAVSLGARRVVVGAQTRARGFYEKGGYQAYGVPYFEEYCEHIHMDKQMR